jgi:hypothetical protein
VCVCERTCALLTSNLMKLTLYGWDKDDLIVDSKREACPIYLLEI